MSQTDVLRVRVDMLMDGDGKAKFDRYTCPSCRSLLINAVQPSCGHWMCQDCADELFTSAAKNGGSPSCLRDDCGEQLEMIDGSNYFPDYFVRKDIFRMVIACVNCNRGCQWTGKYSELNTHIEGCQYSKFQCGLCGKLLANGEDSGNSTTHVGTNARRSPLQNEYIDPFEGESEHAATRRSDSVKGRARPLSTADDSATISGARPPSFIEVPVPLKPVHRELIANDEAVTEGGKRRHFRRRSLESGQILNDESQVQKPVTKARSVDDILAAVSSVSAGTTNPETTHVETSQTVRFRKDPVLPFSDDPHKNETPHISPVHGSVFPMQETDTTNPQYPYSVMGRSASIYPVVSRDEFETRMNAFKQEQHTIKQKVEKLENDIMLLNQTKHEILIPNIEHSTKVAKDKKISAGSVINSPPFYTKDTWGGYKLCVRVYLNGDGKGKGTYLSVFLIVMKGEHDRAKEVVWPFNQKITFTLVNPTPGGEDIVASISTGAKIRTKDPAFQRPKTEMNIPIGYPQFVSHKKLYSGGFVQNDSIVLRVVVDTECIEPLLQLPEHCSEK